MLAWKPDIIRLWNFPKEMKNFTVDSQKNMISFSGSHFRLPLLLRISDKRVEPLPESEYSAPLRFQLADSRRAITSSGSTAATRWVSCGRRKVALSTDWCVSQGQLGGRTESPARR
ncbi:phosphoglycerol transferase I [Klebsiella michiganensis]|uniref:Phosphoglycerol transferase I n=1 Tax=Klebsiella michiganensis TaxID=1134687 RepID=A0A7H4N8B4_9ENTR|nr:phosphoglycerol transferase I [Klebsiella michiganensis]